MLSIAVPSQVLSVTASPEGTTRVLTVSWAQPTYLNAPTVNYTVTYYTTGSSEDTTVVTGPDELRVVLPGLLPFTNYSVTVQACSEAGCGLASDVITQVTLEEGKSVLK